MDIQFEKVRTPFYSLLAVVLLLALLVVFSRHVRYTCPAIKDKDTVLVTLTLYDYLHDHIVGASKQ